MSSIARVSTAAMLEHARVLSERFPHRHTGEPDERGAAEYIANVFRSLGLEVRIHELSVMGWELVHPPEFEVLAPESRALECAPFIFSGSTPHGGLRGRLEYVGPTSVVGIAPDWEKYAIVDESDQPRAFVVGRPFGQAIAQSGPPCGFAGTQDGPHYTWPACIIGVDDLRSLEHWRHAGISIEVRLSLETRYKPGSTSFVVEAALPGTDRPDEVIVVCAHHDCQGAAGFPDAIDSPGGCDNGSGVGAVLELARYYAEAGYPRTLRFCTFGGEEWNLVGSRQYVRSLCENGDIRSIVAAINVDQTANGDVLKVFASSSECPVSPAYDMEAIARSNVSTLGLDARYETEFFVPPTPGSDHWPFYVAGVPIFYAAWDPVPHYHRSGDTVDACTRDDRYEAVVMLIQGILSSLESVPSS